MEQQEKTTLAVTFLLAFLFSFKSIGLAWVVGLSTYIFLRFVQRGPNSGWDEDRS